MKSESLAAFGQGDGMSMGKVVVEEGTWVLYKSPHYDYFHLEHNHWIDHTWKAKWVTRGGECNHCKQTAPDEMLGFLKFLRWSMGGVV